MLQKEEKKKTVDIYFLSFLSCKRHFSLSFQKSKLKLFYLLLWEMLQEWTGLCVCESVCGCVCVSVCSRLTAVKQKTGVCYKCHLSVHFLVLVLCSLQSPGLHLTLESLAAILEVIYESSCLCSGVYNSIRKCLLFFFVFVL